MGVFPKITFAQNLMGAHYIVIFIVASGSCHEKLSLFIHSPLRVVCLVNLLGVRAFGELEFWFSSIKGAFMDVDICIEMKLTTPFLVLSLIGLLLMGIIIDLGSLLVFLILLPNLNVLT